MAASLPPPPPPSSGKKRLSGCWTMINRGLPSLLCCYVGDRRLAKVAARSFQPCNVVATTPPTDNREKMVREAIDYCKWSAAGEVRVLSGGSMRRRPSMSLPNQAPLRAAAVPLPLPPPPPQQPPNSADCLHPSGGTDDDDVEAVCDGKEEDEEVEEAAAAAALRRTREGASPALLAVWSETTVLQKLRREVVAEELAEQRVHELERLSWRLPATRRMRWRRRR